MITASDWKLSSESLEIRNDFMLICSISTYVTWIKYRGWFSSNGWHQLPWVRKFIRAKPLWIMRNIHPKVSHNFLNSIFGQYFSKLNYGYFHLIKSIPHWNFVLENTSTINRFLNIFNWPDVVIRIQNEHFTAWHRTLSQKAISIYVP